MLPLSDGLPARRFPVVSILLIVANFAVFILYELPNLTRRSTTPRSTRAPPRPPARGPEPWGVSWITAMFLHGGWDHILGNMLFLAIFGKNVEAGAEMRIASYRVRSNCHRLSVMITDHI
jgi:membrane associated rhomboid family serine protease